VEIVEQTRTESKGADTKEGTVIRDRLLQLAARCEAASGPDRELDTEIHESVFGALGQIEHARKVSASLDTALLLIPPGFGWAVHGSNVEGVMEYRAQGNYEPYVYGATPALALCAAALKARAALA
jgi:hypothetical protein